ncbi:MAG: signal peptidase I [Actinomycetota bacterium]
MTTSTPDRPSLGHDDDAGAHTDVDPQRGRGLLSRSLIRLIRTTLLVGVIVAAAVLVAARVLITTSEVSGPSMEPTLQSGDTLVANRRATPEVGDIVVVDLELGNGERHGIVKRVIATGGDTIEYRNCRLVVNGQSLIELHVHPDAEAGRCGPDAPRTTVSEGHLWLMGDNRADSVDSRVYGEFDVDDVRGVVVFSF